MKNIDIKKMNDMYDADNYPDLTNGEAFHISLYYSSYRYGIPTGKIHDLNMVYNNAVLNNNEKIKSAIKFLCDWNGFDWRYLFTFVS